MCRGGSDKGRYVSTPANAGYPPAGSYSTTSSFSTSVICGGCSRITSPTTTTIAPISASTRRLQRRDPSLSAQQEKPRSSRCHASVGCTTGMSGAPPRSARVHECRPGIRLRCRWPPIWFRSARSPTVAMPVASDVPLPTRQTSKAPDRRAFPSSPSRPASSSSFSSSSGEIQSWRGTGRTGTLLLRRFRAGRCSLLRGRHGSQRHAGALAAAAPSTNAFGASGASRRPTR